MSCFSFSGFQWRCNNGANNMIFFYKKGTMFWIFFIDTACFQLCGCIISRNSTIWTAEKPLTCSACKILWVCQNRFSPLSVSEKNCWTVFLWRKNYCGKSPKYFDSIHRLPWGEWTELLFSARWDDRRTKKTKLLSCMISSVICCPANEFGHHDLQSSRHLNYFCGDSLN